MDLNKKCVICGFNKYVEKHHIIKRRNLGSDEDENLIYLCPNHHWIADFGSEEDRLFILEKIEKITGKKGCEIKEQEKNLLFKKARRIIEFQFGRYTDEEWKNNNWENSFNFEATIDCLRGNNQYKNYSESENKKAELLLIRDKIDEELGINPFNDKQNEEGLKVTNKQ